MKLYYQDAHLTLYHGDCMDLLATLPDKAFDLAIVDPPYGINVNHNMGRRAGDKSSDYKEAEWDSEAPPEEYFCHLLRSSSNAIVWGANHFIERMPFRSAAWIFWDKLFSNDVSFAAGELAWTNCPGVVKKFTLSSADPSRIHPTQKPVALYKWLLANYAKPGQTILDTHLGSGSIAIACHYAGHHLTAIEKDEDYIKAALERYKRETAQMDMFAPAVEPVIYAQDPLDLPR